MKRNSILVIVLFAMTNPLLAQTGNTARQPIRTPQPIDANNHSGNVAMVETRRSRPKSECR